jgi:hypothetical protein
MANELKKQGLLDTTLIIVTAKHGQSPIDPSRFRELGNGITTTPADVVASLLPAPPSPKNPNTPAKTVTTARPSLTLGEMLGPIGPTQDDVSLLWLDSSAYTTAGWALLETAGSLAENNSIGLGQIFYGSSLETMFNAPGLPPNDDPRLPDIIAEPNVGGDLERKRQKTRGARRLCSRRYQCDHAALESEFRTTYSNQLRRNREFQFR